MAEARSPYLICGTSKLAPRLSNSLRATSVRERSPPKAANRNDSWVLPLMQITFLSLELNQSSVVFLHEMKTNRERHQFWLLATASGNDVMAEIVRSLDERWIWEARARLLAC